MILPTGRPPDLKPTKSDLPIAVSSSETSRARGCGARKHPLFCTPPPVQQGLDGYRGPMARSFGSPSGVSGLAGLVATLFWGLVLIIAGGPSSNSQQVGGNIRDTGGVSAAIQRRHLSFTCDAQQPA